MFDSNNISCEECIEFHKIKGTEPDCNTCPMPKLLPNNYYIIEIVNRYGAMLVDGMGGVMAEGLRYAIELEDIPPEAESATIEKLTKYLSTAVSTTNKQQEGNLTDGTENKNRPNSPRQGLKRSKRV